VLPGRGLAIDVYRHAASYEPTREQGKSTLLMEILRDFRVLRLLEVEGHHSTWDDIGEKGPSIIVRKYQARAGRPRVKVSNIEQLWMGNQSTVAKSPKDEGEVL
jgi:hypothetical protein